MVTVTAVDSGGAPLSVAVTLSSMIPFSSGSMASRSSSPTILNTPVSGETVAPAVFLKLTFDAVDDVIGDAFVLIQGGNADEQGVEVRDVLHRDEGENYA
ncbi:hypothetical protein EYF80_049080 [Liparis tanakae]|uniref:Uncharacterized protein n=1 Tax=Liparis tanakae TaxID=230148 RepID=A0A4Z2FIX9_9TELE|nr:hypothetical protein EYF80_049080 [Liparis tanakae]